MSAHCLGKAIDFNVSGLTNEEVHRVIKENQGKFEYPVRIEAISSAPTWCHIDCIQPINSNSKLIEFK
jgi:hypothetical protein